jgi:hypothetical protein
LPRPTQPNASSLSAASAGKRGHGAGEFDVEGWIRLEIAECPAKDKSARPLVVAGEKGFEQLNGTVAKPGGGVSCGCHAEIR